MKIPSSIVMARPTLDASADHGQDLARQLRRERDARNWSLADLAVHSGVSKGAISKIERGEVSPTAVVLSRLAAAFGFTLAGFVVRAEDTGGPVCRRADQKEWLDPQTKYSRRQIFAKMDHPIDLAQIDFPPGQHVTFPAAAFQARRHLIWVQSGEVVVTIGEEAYRLTAGDSLGINISADVSFENQTDTRCIYAVATAK
jgi:transcriptional regulator with XRE-family HTH domain